MRKWLRVFAVPVLLALAWLGLVLSGWLPRPSEEQRAALATLDAALDGVKGERNAFPAFWLFGYDIPEGELAAVAEADAKAFEQAIADGTVSGFKSTAKGRYPGLPSPRQNDPALCKLWGDDCLARVRASPEASRARLAEFAARLARGDRLADYDHHRYGLRARLDSPVAAPVGLLPLQQTATALDFVDGRVDDAFARLCRDTATWRRLRHRNDSLIVDMVAVAQISGAARLYGEMLAEQPAGFEAPCPDTFAPLTDDEMDQCAVMAHEFRYLRNSIQDGIPFQHHDADAPWPKLLGRLVNVPHVVHEAAPSFAQVCGQANRDRIRRRDPAPLPIDAAPCDAMDWTFDPVGCSVFLIAVPAYNDYFVRVIDLDARLKLLQTAVWLRRQPADGDRAAQFAARPAVWHSPAHVLSYEPAGPTLRMVNLQKGRGDFWEIPFGTGATPAVAPPQPAGGG